MGPEFTDVSVRVLSIREKEVETRSKIMEYYALSESPFPASFPYKSKAIFVFQKQDDQDLCFFG